MLKVEFHSVILDVSVSYYSLASSSISNYPSGYYVRASQISYHLCGRCIPCSSLSGPTCMKPVQTFVLAVVIRSSVFRNSQPLPTRHSVSDLFVRVCIPAHKMPLKPTTGGHIRQVSNFSDEVEGSDGFATDTSRALVNKRFRAVHIRK